MDKINELLEKSSKSKKVYVEEIEQLCLDESEYNILISKLKLSGVQIINRKFEILNNENTEYNSDIYYQYMSDLMKIPKATSEEVLMLLQEYKKSKDPSIKEKIIHLNLKLVISIAKTFVKRNNGSVLELLDLIQEGNIGLIQAIDKFDINMGCKFSTYATIWIWQRIYRISNSLGRTIDAPTYMQADYNKVKYFITNQKEQLGKMPSDSEIAIELGFSEKYVMRLRKAFETYIVSLDETIGESKGTMYEFISGEEDSVEEKVLSKLLREEIINEMQDKLTPKQLQILSMRYGFVNELNICSTPKTLQEIADEFQVTRQDISQIERKALEKLRSFLEESGVDVGRIKSKNKK